MRKFRPGDILLVEGDSEISRWIKLFSASHWSHAVYYIVNVLLCDGHPLTAGARNQFGEDASRLLVEAFTGQGVVISPLAKYRGFNIPMGDQFDYQAPWIDGQHHGTP